MKRTSIRGAVAAIAVLIPMAGTARAADQPKNVTFTKDVVPILQQKCQSCHRPNTVAPMSLLTYEEVRPYVRSIKQRVAGREMPPWHISKNVGIQKFRDDRSLTDEQIATIVAWVDAGAPLGNPKDMPPPVDFGPDAEWQIGKPDLVIAMKEPYVVQAHGPDWQGSHFVDLPLTEDRYFKAIETRVSDRRVVHHAIANMATGERRGAAPRPPDDDPLDSESRGVGDGSETFLNEYALGKGGEIFPEGTARVLKAGSRISFGMHYHSIGEEVKSKTSVGFVFYPKGYKPTHVITDMTLREMDRMDIPPGQMARSDIYFRLPKATRITAYQPHMHARGKSQCLEAILLDGTTQTLNCVDKFDFNWHVMYQYAEDSAPLLPAGTLLHLATVQDNTPTRTNPDPNLWIGWGSRSFDEMTAAHLSFEFMPDADFKQLTARRQMITEGAKTVTQGSSPQQRHQ
jgi:mono/diheme cytochrome c family protein